LQVMDRLGSVPMSGSRYYPYGEESNPPANNVDKFATYYRDGTGLDYADQRYYASTLGRFLTPDPYQASGGPANPASWNRYVYVLGDPINLSDPLGLEECSFVNGVCQVYGGGLPNSLAQLQQDGQRFYNPIAVQNAPVYAEYMAQRTIAEMAETSVMPQGLATLAQVGQLTEPWKDGLVAASAVVNGVGLVAAALPAFAGLIAKEGTTLVIGTVASTTGTISRFTTFALGEGEYKLSWVNRGLDAWNKAVNRSKLLDAMKNGMKIRDSFVDEAGRLRDAAEGSFLEWERNVIKAAGWSYDEVTQMWSRP
jgi:RHS repeat-associated protein